MGRRSRRPGRGGRPDRGVADDRLHQLEQRALAAHLCGDVVEDDQRAAVVAPVAQRREGQPQHAVGVLELQDGKIRRGTGYFGTPFPAQPYRAQFADKG